MSFRKAWSWFATEANRLCSGFPFCRGPSEKAKERILELEKLLQQEAEAREAAEGRTNSAREELEKLRPKEAHGPSWASGSGEDEYGYWVEFTLSSIVKDRPVVQRLRRIEAGSFHPPFPR